jgi:hypothetical protein
MQGQADEEHLYRLERQFKNNKIKKQQISLHDNYY